MVTSQLSRAQSARSVLVALGLVGAFGLAVDVAQANYYGDFAGITLDYLDVEEDNQNLFGPPTVTGDTLSFSPLNFEAMSSGVMPPQLVDGTVSMTLDAKNGYSLDQFVLTESGAFSLVGVGTAATQVVVSVTAVINILEVDGLAITPVIVNDSFILADFNLFDDGVNIGTPWLGSATVDIEALALLAGITGDVTKLELVIDNTLVAVSEAGSTSFIDKKVVNGLTVTIVPEPASLVLMGAACLLICRRRAA